MLYVFSILVKPIRVSPSVFALGAAKKLDSTAFTNDQSQFDLSAALDTYMGRQLRNLNSCNFHFAGKPRFQKRLPYPFVI